MPYQCSGNGLSGMRPRCGFRPTSPQLAAGIRIEPAPSEAVAPGASPAATAAALPPLEPPGVRVGVPWVAGHAEGGTLRAPDDGQLRQVRLSEQNGAGRAQARHELAVGGGGIAERGRAPARDLAGHVLGVLDRERHAQQGAHVAAAAARVGLVGVREGTLGHDDPIGVQHRVETPDAVQVELHELPRGHLPVPHHPRLARHAGECDIVAVHRLGLYSDQRLGAGGDNACGREHRDALAAARRSPCPPLVVNLTFTSSGARPAASARRSRIASRNGPSLGSSQSTTASRFTGASRLLARAARTRVAAAPCCRRPASARRCRGSAAPMSPRPAAPSSASISACASASASEWPARPFGDGTSTPPSTSLRPASKRCESKPMPGRALIRAAPGAGCAPRRPPAR